MTVVITYRSIIIFLFLSIKTTLGVPLHIFNNVVNNCVNILYKKIKEIVTVMHCESFFSADK